MNKQRYAQGSALLMVLFLTTAVTLVACVIMRKSIYGVDLAYEQTKAERIFRMADGLMRYAISLAQENYDSLIKSNTHSTFKFNNWPSKDSLFRGVVTITKVDTVLIRVELLRANQILCVLNCSLERVLEGEKQQYVVRNWRFDDNKTSAHTR